MMGDDILSNARRGIIPRMVDTVFDKIAKAGNQYEFTIKVSYAEIYLERIRDLLNPV